MDTQDILNAVISKVQRNDKFVSRIVIGRKLIFEKCDQCGARLTKVKIYLYYPKGNKDYRIDDEYTCFECGNSKTAFTMSTDF